MGRQILTFALVFLGIILLTRYGCSSPPPHRGLAVERPDEPPEDAFVLRHPGSGASAYLSPDGSVARITEGSATVMRPVPASRRPFHVFEGETSKPTSLREPWTAEDVDGGRRYVYAKDKLRIEKTIRFAEDGKALVLDLKAEGIPDAALVLTGASGMALDESSFAFSELAQGKPVTHSLAGLVQTREETLESAFALRERLDATGKVKRFGVLGSAFGLSLEELPAVSLLFVDVYRAEREGSETEEIESWLDLVAPGGAYEGRFTLRWQPRAEAAQAFGSAPVRPGKDFAIEDDTFRIVFTDRGAAIRELWLKRYATVAGEPLSPTTWVPLLGGTTREGERALTLSAEGHGGDPAHDIWEATVAPDGKSIRFTLALPDGWKIAKQVSLPEGGRFDLGVDIEVEAPAGTAAGQATVLSLVGPAGSYFIDSYRGIIGADPPAAFVLDHGGGDSTETIDALGKAILDRSFVDRRGFFKAVGTRGAYFVCALVSEDRRNAVTSAVAKRITLTSPQPRADGKPPTADSMLGRVALTLPIEGGRATQRFRLYAGPNETAALRALNIGECVNFGTFGFIGRALMWLMKALQHLVGSYGIAIMLMTVIVRGLLLPVSYRTQLSMQRYSKRLGKIKPLLDELQKKYAKDPQRMNQERMKVMREHGVGLPLGCLTMFLQIPIWFALFQALRVEFALRHQPFLWAKDLSMPDRLFALPHSDAFLLSYLPPWFNLLPILMLVLWVLQQKLAPTPGSDDPQVKMQMKMMKFMPFVFFFMLYNYAAGLALYMCVSSCWTIAESKLVRRAIARLG